MMVVVTKQRHCLRSRHCPRDASCRERRPGRTVSTAARHRPRRAHTAAADRHVLTPDVIAKRTKRHLDELEVCVSVPTNAV